MQRLAEVHICRRKVLGDERELGRGQRGEDAVFNRLLIEVRHIGSSILAGAQ